MDRADPELVQKAGVILVEQRRPGGDRAAALDFPSHPEIPVERPGVAGYLGPGLEERDAESRPAQRPGGAAPRDATPDHGHGRGSVLRGGGILRRPALDAQRLGAAAQAGHRHGDQARQEAPEGRHEPPDESDAAPHGHPNRERRRDEHDPPPRHAEPHVSPFHVHDAVGARSRRTCVLLREPPHGHPREPIRGLGCVAVDGVIVEEVPEVESRGGHEEVPSAGMVIGEFCHVVYYAFVADEESAAVFPIGICDDGEG